MRWLRLVVCLALSVPAGALLGAFSALNSGGPPWLGVAAGVLVGVFFGLVFSGDPRWKAWDYFFGPKVPPPRDGDPSEEWHG